jgi:hypothetical protein
MPTWTAILRIERPRPALARALGLAGALAIAAGGAACVEAQVPPPEMPPPAPDGPPVAFEYETCDGGVLTSASLRGRFTVLAFVATYDLVSQAQVKVLGLVQRDHAPRVNVAALIIGPPENRPIAVAFGQSLAAPFPIAMAGTGALEGRGPFAGVRAVPSVVILDRDGRLVLRHTGPMEEKELRAELTRLGARR